MLYSALDPLLEDLHLHVLHMNVDQSKEYLIENIIY